MHLRSWQALAVLWCAQTPVVNRAVDTQGNRLGEPFSTCTSYRRPLSRSLEDCLRFCPAIEESCAAAPALVHCEARCREIHPSTYCEVLTISGLQEGATNWPAKVDDLNTRYRMLVRQCTSGDAHCRAYCRAHCPAHDHAQCRVRADEAREADHYQRAADLPIDPVAAKRLPSGAQDRLLPLLDRHQRVSALHRLYIGRWDTVDELDLAPTLAQPRPLSLLLAPGQV